MSSFEAVTKYANIFDNWDVEKENQKALFMEILYKKSGRTDGLLTGLWEDFKQKSAEFARDQYFI